MRKLLFLLLLPIIAVGQVSTGQEQEFDTGIKNNAAPTVAVPNYLTTASATGVYGKIEPINLQISTSTQTALDLKINNSLLGANNGVATLDSGGKVPLSQINDALLGSVNYKGTYNASTNTPALPTVASGNKGFYFIVSTAGTQVGLTLNAGDWVISNGVSWNKVDNNNAVTSVNGFVGSVVLTKSDIGLSNVDNTSDANKPISTAEQNALNLKANLAGPTFTGVVTAPTIAVNSASTNSLSVGSGTVTFAGVATAPTAAAGTNTTQLATTAFVLANASSTVAQTITNGVTNSAPSQDAVFDALALKLNKESPIFTGSLFGQGNIVTEGSFLLGGTNSGLVRYGASGISFKEVSNVWVSSAPISATSFNGGATLTGVATAPTASTGTNTTQLATTAFVLANSTPLIPYLEFNNTTKGVWNNGLNNLGANTAFGEGAIQATTSGNGNTAYGLLALGSNTVGSDNIAVGQRAGFSSSTINGPENQASTKSVFLGGFTTAKNNNTSNTNEIIIGYEAIGEGSNSVTLGNTAITLTRLRGSVLAGSSVTTDSATITNLSGTGIRVTTSDASGNQGALGLVPLRGYTVATLPAGQQQGMTAFVTDALAPSYMVGVVGGGAVATVVFYNGTSWISH